MEFAEWDGMPMSELILSDEPDTYDNTPTGYREISIKAYTNGQEIVVCEQRGIGTPDEDGGEPEAMHHNCDQLGCSSVSHVICRGYALVRD